jgi:MarR family 2-MHQ and catechol resistance regulon transcriptional repressor
MSCPENFDPAFYASRYAWSESPDDPTGVAAKLLIRMALVYRTIERELEADIARHGLTPSEFGTLDMLYHRGPMLLGDIQRRLVVSSGGITFLVDRLAAKGLVERKACPGDRRARFAVLTPEGERFVEERFPAHGRFVTELVSGLSEEEQVELTRLIGRLGRSVKEHTAQDEG